MSRPPVLSWIRELGRASLPSQREATDADLLTRFLARRDAPAFEALLARHGPMVLGVCGRLLADPRDVEDAFQATWLVFVQKASSVSPRGQVGNWLHGVALRTARHVRTANARRLAKEGTPRPMSPLPDVAEDLARRELRALLDLELSRLPESYRAAVVACDLEGRTHREAARVLGWPKGTLSARLWRGRQLLARRLSGRGLALPAVGLVGFLGEGFRVGVSRRLHHTVLRLFAGDPVPFGVATLREGVLKTMYPNLLKIWVAAVVAVAALAFGAGLWLRPARAEKPAEAKRPVKAPEKVEPAADPDQLKALGAVRWTLWGYDAKGRTLHVVTRPSLSAPSHFRLEVWTLRDSQQELHFEDLPVAKDATITVDGKKGGWEDLAAGLACTLRLAKDKLAVEAITATRRVDPPGYVLKGVDAKRRRIDIADKGWELENLRVPPGTYIYLFGKGNEGDLGELKVGMRVSVHLEMKKGRMVVRRIYAAPGPKEK